VIPLFLALDAKVTLFDGKYHSIPLSDLYPTRSHLSGSILTEVLLPLPSPRTAASFHQFSRTGFDVALLNCACLVRVDADRCSLVRIVAGGTPRLGAALPAAEEALMGMELTDETIEQVAHVARESVDTRGDRRASAQYRKQLTYVCVKRCLQEIRDRLAWGEQ
jgi:CO/xanthine dehydrogenase FAD-binding subunit